MRTRPINADNSSRAGRRSPRGTVIVGGLAGVEGDRQVVEHDVTFSVSDMSCIIGLPATSMSTVRRALPSAPITEYCTVLPRYMLYETACSSPVSGSRLGCAV